MRLRHVELHGYKTFASRTQFAFEDGITAIVGPNGSGKSNIADGIRWVLGEQSYRVLRGKRTEDMIFSGSAQRARLGMASVSLLLDNADGWLPIDFSEVTVTRRAYRAGENEYLINGRRVRLGDVVELLAKSGLAQRTYAVIGQGLVDAVLSLRADDRRALFEEAAGIAVYRSKRSDALARLEETRTNLLRVNDIINEIAPRLHRLEREAERTKLRALLTEQLDAMLHTAYGYRWHQMQLDLHRARDKVERRKSRVARIRQELEGQEARTAALRGQQSRLRDEMGGWHRESAQLHRQMEEVQLELAVWQERARLLGLQCDELDGELRDLQVLGEAAAEQVATAEADVVAGEAALAQRGDAVESAQRELDRLEARREELARHLADAQDQVLALATRFTAHQSLTAEVQTRRWALLSEKDGHVQALASLDKASAGLRARREETVAQLAQVRSDMDRATAETGELGAALADLKARQAQLRTLQAERELSREQLRTRLELLTRLRQEGEGLASGAKALLHAARDVDLSARGGEPGTAHRSAQKKREEAHGLLRVVGAIAQLVEAPAQYEAAIEMALGQHVEDIVVETWNDAEAAIAFLHGAKKGRATLWPVDTVRPEPRIPLPQVPGVIGVASELVKAPERLAPVVEALLGRTLIVQDLPSARLAFDRLQGSFNVVSLAGEVLRSDGSVTGGQGEGQERGRLLAREREWRELPAQLEVAERHLGESREAIDAAAEAEEALHRKQQEVETYLKTQADAAAGLDAVMRELDREWDRIRQESTWRQGLIGQLDSQAGELEAQAVSLQADLGRLSRDREVAELEVAAVQGQLGELRGDLLYQQLSDARTAAAVARRSWEHGQAVLDGLRLRRAELQAQAKAKQERLAGLRREQAALAQQIQEHRSREVVIQGWLAALSEKIQPAEQEVAHLEAEHEALITRQDAVRTRLRRVEDSHAQALLDRSRNEDRRQRLRRQIIDDFGLVDMEPMEDLPDQPPLPLVEIVSSLPVVDLLPAGLDDDILQLRAQIKRMGPVNPGAPQEYSEVRQRHEFLTTQAADLEEAALHLRDVIAEVDEVMRREFARAFEAVSVRFQENFAELFGGGTARLTLTDPEDMAVTGVEIVARPPGKRQQTLALLSGGERALTAVALIFAFLQANPPPFCILDEVDAMLDESNVQRFRQMLQTLAQGTQFIVITHNRTTIQAADTIYGVSMGDDSVSQVVSLRLEGDRVVTPSGSHMQLGVA